MPETVKIIDFGIAKGLAQDGTGVPTSGAWMMMGPSDRPELDDVQRTLSSLIGTPGFMAPEQIRGTPTDARTDQYAIGCILYQMLTGTLVFSGPTPQDLLLLHLIENPEPPRKRIPELGISNELENIVLRLIAKEPEDRFPSLHEVEAELAAELMLLETDQPSHVSVRTGGQSKSSYRSGGTDALPPPPPSTPKVSVLRWVLPAAVVGLGLLGLGGLVTSWLQRPPPAVVTPPTSVDELQRLRERALAVLSEQARNPAPQIRHRALETLGQSHAAQALPVLQGVYQGGTDTEQAAALEALGQLGERQAVPLLQTALREAKAAAVQRAAAQALMALGEESGVQFLEQRLTQGDRQEQRRVALLLCERGHKQATEKLTTLLEESKGDDDEALRGLACQVRAGKNEARQKLIARLNDPGNSEGRVAVAATLHRLGDPAGKALLSELAGRPGPQRLMAARLLSAPYEPVGLELFRSVLGSRQGDSRERQEAIEGLGICGQPEVLKLLEPLLAPKTPPLLRQSAAGSTLQVVGRDARLLSIQSLSWARAAVGDANWLVRYAAVPLIAESDAPDSVALLTQSLRDLRKEVRLRATWALGKRLDTEVLRSLSAMLKDSDETMRRASARALLRVTENIQKGATAVPDATAFFRELLKNGSEEEQTVARAGLLRLGDAGQRAELDKLKTAASPAVRALLIESVPTDRELLVALLADSNADVRTAAAQRLAELGDRRSLPLLGEALKHSGAEAVRAYGALLHLGEGATAPPELQNLSSIDDVGQRLALIEDAGVLPRPESVSLLVQAAQDVEPFVRRLVAEEAAELTDGGPGSPLIDVLTRLSRDPMAMVWMRAETLLARALSPNKARDAAKDSTGPASGTPAK